MTAWKIAPPAPTPLKRAEQGDMHKRISELEAQCWDHGRGVVNTRKLAELLIYECARLADNCPVEYLEEVGKYPSTWIKEHFGAK